tara:strand:- start:35 stop:220 length:186 start_codon:yes stop_codon:yes gene_type:complete
MAKFILVIILNTTPQYIQVFHDREQCSMTANLINKTENVQSYCVPAGTNIIATVPIKEITG